MKSKFISSLSIYALSNIINAAIPLIVFPILARTLTVEEFGQIALFFSIIALFNIFSGNIFIGAFERKFFALEKRVDALRKYSFLVFCSMITMIISLFILIFIFSNEFSTYTNLENKYCELAVVYILANSIIQFTLSQLVIRKIAIHYAIISIGLTIFGSVLTLILILYYDQGVSGRINSFVGTALIFAIFSIFLLYKKHFITFAAPSINDIKEIWLYSIPLVPHVTAGYLINSVDKLIIGGIVGSEQLGFYAVAFQLAAAIGLFFDVMRKTLQPILFEYLTNDTPCVRKKIVTATYLIFFMLLVLSIIVFSFSDEIIEIIAGSKYKDIGMLFFMLFVGQIFKGMYLCVVPYLFFESRTWLISKVTMGCGIFNVLSLYIFINLFGIYGAILSFVTTSVIRFIIVFYFANIVRPMPWIFFLKDSEKK